MNLSILVECSFADFKILEGEAQPFVFLHVELVDTVYVIRVACRVTRGVESVDFL